MHPNDLKVGDEVWFYEYDTPAGLRSGKIIHIKDNASYSERKRLICVETSETLKVIQVEGGDRSNVWTNSWEPKLQKAKQIQLEASRKLEEAARLFTEAHTSEIKSKEPQKVEAE